MKLEYRRRPDGLCEVPSFRRRRLLRRLAETMGCLALALLLAAAFALDITLGATLATGAGTFLLARRLYKLRLPETGMTPSPHRIHVVHSAARTERRTATTAASPIWAGSVDDSR